MKLLLSAAAVVVAVLFCLFSPPFIYSLSVYFSSTVHKNYIFLLCNGILLLLVQSSGLISDFPVHSDCGEAIMVKDENREKTMPTSFETMETPKEEIKAVFQIEDVKETENGPSSSPRVEEIEALIEQDAEEDEDEEAAYVAAMMMSREELNKKCDDFIRKMKVAIHSEMHRLVLA